MIKVMHLMSTHVFSGAENVACQIIRMFKDDKNYQMYYTSQIKSNKEILENKNIPIIPLKKFNIFEIRKKVKETKPQIIHAHDIKSSIAASIFYKKATIIAHVHTNNQNMRRLNIKTLLFNLCSKRFTKIIWVSKSALGEYYFKDKVKDKSIVLYNVIDKSEIEELAKKDNEKYLNYDIIFLGRLTPVKDPMHFLKIISALQKNIPIIKVAIIGTGELEDDVKEKIKELALENNIDMLGFKNNPYKVLANSKILLLTSKYEGTPMVVLESLALNTIVVSLKTDGVNDIIKNNENGFLSNDDTQITEFIESILTDKTKEKEIISKIKKTFPKINDIKEYKKTIDNIYQEGVIK